MSDTEYLITQFDFMEKITLRIGIQSNNLR